MTGANPPSPLLPSLPLHFPRPDVGERLDFFPRESQILLGFGSFGSKTRLNSFNSFGSHEAAVGYNGP